MSFDEIFCCESSQKEWNDSKMKYKKIVAFHCNSILLEEVSLTRILRIIYTKFNYFVAHSGQLHKSRKKHLLNL